MLKTLKTKLGPYYYYINFAIWAYLIFTGMLIKNMSLFDSSFIPLYYTMIILLCLFVLSQFTNITAIWIVSLLINAGLALVVYFLTFFYILNQLGIIYLLIYTFFCFFGPYGVYYYIKNMYYLKTNPSKIEVYEFQKGKMSDKQQLIIAILGIAILFMLLFYAMLPKYGNINYGEINPQTGEKTSLDSSINGSELLKSDKIIYAYDKNNPNTFVRNINQFNIYLFHYGALIFLILYPQICYVIYTVPKNKRISSKPVNAEL